MINMFSHMACICHFVFYALPRASYGYIQCGFIPSVVWRFSIIFSSSLGIGILALNRVFPTFSGRHVFILGVVWMPPHLYASIHLYAPRGVHTPYMPPILFCASVCFWRLCIMWGVIMGFPLCWDTSLTPPLFGIPPLQLHPPHSVIGSQCISMFQGYQYVMWAFPFC